MNYFPAILKLQKVERVFIRVLLQSYSKNEKREVLIIFKLNVELILLA